MRRIIVILAVLSASVVLSALIFRVSADVGTVLVFDTHPFLGSGGIQPVPLKSGSCVKWPWTRVYRVDVLPVQYHEPFENLISMDMASVSLNAFITMQVNENEASRLLKNFGPEWYANNIQEPFREMVRNKLCSYPLRDLTGNRNVYEEIKDHLREAMEEYVYKKGIPASIENIVISRAEPSESVRQEMDNLSKENARLQTEMQRKKTEQARLETEIARARADRAYMQTMGFSRAEFIEHRKAEALLLNPGGVFRIGTVD